jgi:hypothetical protein
MLSKRREKLSCASTNGSARENGAPISPSCDGKRANAKRIEAGTDARRPVVKHCRQRSAGDASTFH